MFFFAKSAREPCKCPWKHVKICPWTSKSVREHSIFFAREPQKRARENVQKIARERNHLPVNFPWKVPVNQKKCPWTSSKKQGSRALLMLTGEKKTLSVSLYIIYPII